jgi:hypothetical protein
MSGEKRIGRHRTSCLYAHHLEMDDNVQFQRLFFVPENATPSPRTIRFDLRLLLSESVTADQKVRLRTVNYFAVHPSGNERLFTASRSCSFRGTERDGKVSFLNVRIRDGTERSHNRKCCLGSRESVRTCQSSNTRYSIGDLRSRRHSTWINHPVSPIPSWTRIWWKWNWGQCLTHSEIWWVKKPNSACNHNWLHGQNRKC